MQTKPKSTSTPAWLIQDGAAALKALKKERKGTRHKSETLRRFDRLEPGQGFRTVKNKIPTIRTMAVQMGRSLTIRSTGKGGTYLVVRNS